MKPQHILYLVIGIVAFFVTVMSSMYTIHEGRQAIITQFGRPVRTVKEAGLHFKVPFIQAARMIDLRILNWDGKPNQIPTEDKKYIEVDTTARWKITDPLKFIQTVQNERGAKSRLDAVLDGATRDVISSHQLVEAVRNSNDIITRVEKQQQKAQKKKEKGKKVKALEEKVTSDVERIEVGREKLSENIIKEASKELERLGVDLIDVQLKRISYQDRVQTKVYDRMISERQRIAEKIRSIGQGEKQEIIGRTERDKQEIQSEAYESVQQIKGEAEAKAIAIYAKSVGQNPDFYEFTRSLDAYKKSLKKNPHMILSTDSQFWEVLKEGR